MEGWKGGRAWRPFHKPSAPTGNALGHYNENQRFYITEVGDKEARPHSIGV